MASRQYASADKSWHMRRCLLQHGRRWLICTNATCSDKTFFLCLQVLQLAVVAQPVQLCRFDCDIMLSCTPHPLHSLGNTHVVCLKFIESDRDQHCGNVEEPVERPPQGGVLFFGEVVRDARPITVSVVRSLNSAWRDSLETNMGVDDHSRDKNSIESRIQRASRERSDC